MHYRVNNDCKWTQESKGYISLDKVIGPVSKELGVPVVIGLAAGVCLILTMSIGLAWSIMPKSLATIDNSVGFAARVAYLRNFTHSCLMSPCHDIDTFMLKTASAKPVWFLGWVICDAKHFPPCVNVEGFAGGVSSAETLSLPPCQWGMMTIGTVNWQSGETVHIWVKIAPHNAGETDPSQIDIRNIRWVDLGESEIFEYNHREFRMTGHC